MNEDQQLREAAMRLAILASGPRGAGSLTDQVELANIYEHYLRTGDLPPPAPGTSY